MSDIAEPESSSNASVGAFWRHVHDNKVIQWGLAYLGAALALAHGAELLGHAFHWPEGVWRSVVIALVVGFPVALTLAWYHGHRGLTTCSAPETMIISVLLLIGAVFFYAATRAGTEHSATAAPTTSVDSDLGTDARVTSTPPDVASSAVSLLPNSVAVLPLENLSSDPEHAYYANGMHAEIISQLTKLRNLTVISRASVLRYAVERPPLLQIATDLGVQSLLTGRFQYAAGRIRVGVELVDPVSGAILWNDGYEREFAEIFAVQADISMNVANALQTEFSPEEQARIERPPTSSPEAYSLYLQALALNAGAGLTRDDARIVSWLEEAIRLDERFASAYALLAFYHANALNNSVYATAVEPARRSELEATVRRYASTALELDDQQGLAHLALGQLAWFNWRWTEAERDFAQAFELSPQAPNVALWYGYLLSYQGRHDESLAVGERVRGFDPQNPSFGLGYKLTMAGKYDEAAVLWHQRVQNTGATAPVARLWLGFTEIARGNDAEALTQLGITEGLLGDAPPIVFLSELAWAYSRVRQTGDARRLFDKIAAEATAGVPIGAGGWAAAYLAIGDQEHALEQLELVAQKAARQEPDPGFTVALNLKVNPTNDPVLRQPEFAEVLDRIRGH